VKKPGKAISIENEGEYLRYLREHFKRRHKRGNSDREFVLWVEEKLDDFRRIEKMKEKLKGGDAENGM
jgi:hypothetical protein